MELLIGRKTFNIEPTLSTLIGDNNLLSITIIILSICAFLPLLVVAYTEPKDMDNSISSHDNIILPIADTTTISSAILQNNLSILLI